MAEKNWTQAQIDAIESRDRSVAVSAAAGSGKTAVLTRRIIEHICAPDGSGDISRMLVVTFMREAAAELVSRISAALTEELAKDPSNKHISRQLLLVSSARISTIHSFCLDVIRRDFGKLGLPSDFHAADATELKTIMNDTASRLIDDLYEGVADDCAVSDFLTLADTFGSIKNESELVDNLVDIYNKLSARAEFLDALDIYANDYASFAAEDFLRTPWGRQLLDYSVAVMKHGKKELTEYIGRIRFLENSELVTNALNDDCDGIDEFLRKASNGSSYSDIGAFLKGFKFTTAHKSKVPDLDAEEFDRIRKRNKDVIKAVAGYMNYSADVIADACRVMSGLMRDLSAVMRAYHRRLTNEKNKRHIISFADMEQMTLSLLWDKKEQKPTDLANEIASEFDEIYIDEYQDTNSVQDMIFRQISREDNRFCVGDVKQSIYGFRGAEPSLFTSMIESRNKYDKDKHDKEVKIFLSNNFRSSNEILGFTNDIFTRIMNLCGNIPYGDDDRLIPGLNISCGKVRVAVADKASDDDEEMPQEAEYVASEIERLLRDGKKADQTPITPGDIVIILRSGTRSQMYADALERHGIPNSNTTDNEFFGSPEVLLMMSILNTIDNPSRDVYLAAALKSPIYGVTMDELIHIRGCRNDGTLYDALCKFTEEHKFKKGERFLSDIAKYRRMANTMPCDKLIWRIYLDTGIMSVVSKKDADNLYSAERAKSNLIQLYNFARQCEKGMYRGLFHFISLINGILRDGGDNDTAQFNEPGNKVKLITVHKSKGLEYPVVFLCSCGTKFNAVDKTKKYMFAPWGIVPRLIGKNKTPIMVAADKAYDYHNITEEMRLLYVSLTRAREKLYVVGSVRLKDGETAARHMASLKADDEYSVLKANSFLDMIGSTAVTSDDCEFIDINIAPTDDKVLPVVREAEPCDDMLPVEARKLVRDRLTFRYEYDWLNDIPSKLSVSCLYPDVLDGSDLPDRPDEEIQADTYLPAFLRDDGTGFTAAERGTAMHTFMQFFDFDRVARNGVEAEVGYLLSHGFLFASDEHKLNLYKLKKFFSSKLCAEMRSAQRIWREKRFMTAFPADKFTLDDELRSKLAGETLLVQGVIDCAYLDGDGKVVLVDYKTDSFPHGTSRDDVITELTKRHSRQLEYYKFACEKLFGEVSHVYIYSFALDDAIELTIGG